MRVEEWDISQSTKEEIWFLINREMRTEIPLPDFKVFLLLEDSWKEMTETEFLEVRNFSEQEDIRKRFGNLNNKNTLKKVHEESDGSLVDRKYASEKLDISIEELEKESPLYEQDYSILLRKNANLEKERSFRKVGYLKKDYLTFVLIHEMIHVWEHEAHKQVEMADDKIPFQIFQSLKERENARQRGKTFLEAIVSVPFGREIEISFIPEGLVLEI